MRLHYFFTALYFVFFQFWAQGFAGSSSHSEAPRNRARLTEFLQGKSTQLFPEEIADEDCNCDVNALKGLVHGDRSLEKSSSHTGLLSSSCVSCHSNDENGFKIEPWMDDKSEWEKALKSEDQEKRKAAFFNLGRLYNTLVAQKNMPPLSEAESRKAFQADSRHAEFVAFIKKQYEENHPLKDLVKDASVAPNRVSVMSKEEEDKYRALFPKVESPLMTAVLNDPNLLIIDKAHMAPGYQDPSNPVVGERSTEPGFKGAGFAKDSPFIDKNGHLNLWSFGFGLEQSPSAESFHFIRLPKDEKGALKKIKVSSHGTSEPDGGKLYEWEFPVGTISGEVILGTDSEGKKHVLELRTKIKDRSEGPWAADVFRPFPTADSLKTKLDSIVKQNGTLASEAEKVIRELSKPDRLKRVSLGMHGYQKGDLDSSGGTETLPEMSQALSLALLNEPFKSSLGAEWASENGITAFAPTTAQSFGIVPQNNNSGALRVGRESCGKCHERSNTPIREFYEMSHPKYYSSIVAYANTPGNDQQLRFHIFDPSEFKNFGNNNVKDNRKINSKLLPILEVTDK